MNEMSDFKQIRKLNIYFEINIMCVAFNFMRGFMGFFWQIYQNLSANFGAPKTGCRSQKTVCIIPYIF